MKKDFLQGLGLEEDVIKKVFAENGKDIQEEKNKYEKLEKEKLQLENDIKAINTKFENKTAKEWKDELDILQEKIAEDKKQAKALFEQNQKEEMIQNRFNAVIGEKKFAHDAIKADYIKKFGEALENKDFTGKSDNEIFTELTENDESAFVGVERVVITGANNAPTTELQNNAVKSWNRINY